VISNLDPFQLLIKPVSAKCNAHCSYCFYTKIPQIFPQKPLKTMSLETLELLIKKFLALRFQDNVFFWQGGEPLLAGLDFYKNAIEFQQKYGKNQIIGNALQTNGLLITDEWAKLFNQYKFLIGISLDGPEAIHDEYRGKGTHKKVLNAIEILKKNNVEFNILTVLHKDNADKITEIYSYLKTLPTKYFQFIPALDNNPFDNRPLEYSITSELYEKSLCQLFDLWYPNDIKNISIRDFDAVINGMLGLPKGVCSLRKFVPLIWLSKMRGLFILVIFLSDQTIILAI
jgi:uncharacterized protein